MRERVMVSASLYQTARNLWTSSFLRTQIDLYIIVCLPLYYL